MADAIELLRLGPFVGADFTSAGEYTKPGYASAATSVNSRRVTGALMAERGRVPFFSAGSLFAQVTVLSPVTLSGDQGAILVGGYNSTGGFVAALAIEQTGALTQVQNAQVYDQAVQLGQVVYTNGGQRFFLTGGTSSGPVFSFYEWQYPTPPSAATVTLTPTTGTGSMAAGTYSYLFTRSTTMPDGSISETSVNLTDYDAPPTVTLSATGEVTLTASAAFPFSGTNADGSSYTVNAYRSSLAQPSYLLDGTAIVSPYVDTQSDQTISSGAQLQTNRDQPPTIPGSYGLAPGQGNLGAICVHQNRMWVYVVVLDPTSTVSTNTTPEIQLWYSNLGRGWEFNQTSQVLLLTQDVTSYPTPATLTYQNLYGNDPVALCEVGSILCALSRRLTWGIYGDDATSYVQRPLFNIGATSRHSVLGAVGGMFWDSENGTYFFDGGALQYDEEYIRGRIQALGKTGASAADRLQGSAVFSKMTYYLSYPTLGVTYGYDTVSGSWLSTLPYAPGSAAASMFVPAQPTTAAAGLIPVDDLGEVVAARPDLPDFDYWFADPNNDLGNPLSCSWTGPLTDASTPERNIAQYEKLFTHLTLLAPVQPGTATVTLSVDPGAPNARSVSVTFDLSCMGKLSTMNGQPLVNARGDALDISPRHIVSLGDPAGGELRGYLGQLSVTLTGIAGQDAPQVWAVAAWGIPTNPLVVRT